MSGDESVTVTASIPVITDVKATAATSANQTKIVWTVQSDDGVGSTALEIDGTAIAPSSISSSVSGATITYTYTGLHTYAIRAAGSTGTAAKTTRGSFAVTPATSGTGAAGGCAKTMSTGSVSGTDRSTLAGDDKAGDSPNGETVIAGSSVIGAIAWWPWRMRRRARNTQRSGQRPQLR